MIYRVLSALPRGGFHAHTGAKVFDDPLVGATAAAIGYFNAFDRLTQYVGWQAADDWRKWATLVRSLGWLDFER